MPFPKPREVKFFRSLSSHAIAKTNSKSLEEYPVVSEGSANSDTTIREHISQIPLSDANGSYEDGAIQLSDVPCDPCCEGEAS